MRSSRSCMWLRSSLAKLITWNELTICDASQTNETHTHCRCSSLLFALCDRDKSNCVENGAVPVSAAMFHARELIIEWLRVIRLMLNYHAARHHSLPHHISDTWCERCKIIARRDALWCLHYLIIASPADEIFQTLILSLVILDLWDI